MWYNACYKFPAVNFQELPSFSSNITDGAYTTRNLELQSCQDKLSTLHAIIIQQLIWCKET